MAWSSGGASARVGDCSWPPPGDCEGSCIFRDGESKGNSSKLLVSLSYLTCGRFLRHPCGGLGVWYLLAAEPPSVGRHNEDVACRQAREPWEKIDCLLPVGILPLIKLVFFLWLVHSSTWWHNHLTHSFTFPQTSCSKLFSVARIESLLCSLSSSSGALLV